jgi:hypothetical protein
MGQDSPDRQTYESRIVKRFGDQQELDFGHARAAFLEIAALGLAK